MHSPGGIPGISPAVMWNASAAERQWSRDSSSLRIWDPLLIAGGGALSLSAIGALYRSGILGYSLYQATRPHWWAVYNAYKEQADIRHALKGGKFKASWSLTSRPIALKGFMHRMIPVSIPFPWIDFQGYHTTVDGSSTQDLVQYGGPSAPLVQRGKSSDVLSLGKTLKTQSAHGFRSGKARTAGGKRRTRRKKCPPGYFWSYQKRKCVRSLPWHLRQRQKYNQRSSNGRKR